MKIRIPKFRLAKKYVTSVVERKKIKIQLPDGTTQKGTSQGSIDHPEFTKLREKLGREGYIEIERDWWNGDRVLKPFVFNKLTFKVGEKFGCAAYLSVRLSLLKK